MKRFTIIATFLVLIISLPVSAQDFEVIPDSTEGMGRLNELNLFDSFLRNLWDQQNDILWQIDRNLPEGWFVEICQLSRICWSPFVDSDTIKLASEATDSLQVKFYAHRTEGTGSITILLTALADTSFHWGATFVLNVPEVSVRNGRQGGSDIRRTEILGFCPDGRSGGSHTTQIFAPFSTDAELKVFDILGRLTANPWKGRLNAGENTVATAVDLSPGVYLVRLELKTGESTVRKMLITR